MPFPSRLLGDGEEVVLDVRPHWWYLSGPVAAVVAVLAGAIAAYIEGVPTAADWALLAVLVAAMGWLLVRYARWAATSLVVTTDRLVHRSGVISKNGREIPLDQLSDIRYHQTIFERLIGAGDLVLESAGRDSREVFEDLPGPASIQAQIYRQLSSQRRRSQGASLSVPEQIEKLDDLRRRGVITQAEFEAHKARLLERM